MRRVVSDGAVLLVAKCVFVVAGYALYSGLARLLTQDDFGIYVVVNSVVAVLNALVITGTIQTVSRFISARDEAHAAGVMYTVLRLQVLLALVLGTLYAAAAPTLAAWLGDPTLVPLLRISAVIPMAYALYAVYVGHLNGRRRFVAQALFDMSFSVLKVTAILGLVVAGYAVMGAITGFAVAAVVVMLVAMAYVRPAVSATTAVAAAVLLQFESTVMAYQGISNLSMQLDVLLLKAFTSSADANQQVAELGAAVKLAQIPQSLLVALNFLVFPLVAKAVGEKDAGTARTCVRTALTACLALVLGPAVLLAGAAAPLMSLVYGSRYASGGTLLAVLCGAYACFALLGILLTMMNGAGRPLTSLAIVACTLGTQLAASVLFIPSMGALGAAVATCTGFVAGMGLALIVVRRHFGAGLDLGSALRTMSAAAAVGLCGLLLPSSGLWMVGELALLGTGYLVLLFLVGAVEWRGWVSHVSPPAPAPSA